MRKIGLSVLLLFFKMLSAHGQSDSSAYKLRKLHVEEINFVSAYYAQDGNNSAVTGGTGTEKLTDFANTIELKLLKTNARNIEHHWGIELGVDHYSSASSDNIDPGGRSSASRSDTRIYPSLTYSLRNPQKGYTIGAVGSLSTEFDYKSYGLGVNVAKQSKDNNRELALKLQAYFDTWKVIYPVELRPGNGNKYSGHDGDNQSSPRNSYSASLSFSQVMNKRLQLALLADGIYQTGLLATEYQRVYFTDNAVKVENLPDKRYKLPLGIRGSYFLGDRIVVRAFYRYYLDDWGVKAHTANIELPVKLSPFVSVSPFYRFYTQTAANYFAPYKEHITSDIYYTSDYDLSKFNSQFFGVGIRIMPEKGILGIRKWNMLEIRYGHYLRNTGLHSDIITLNARFK